jgi:hypothetical protein
LHFASNGRLPPYFLLLAVQNPARLFSFASSSSETFISKILPDLNSEAVRIVGGSKMKALLESNGEDSEMALVEVSRNQLCPEPYELSFVKKFLDDLNNSLGKTD